MKLLEIIYAQACAIQHFQMDLALALLEDHAE
jgi:hypothetical protein